MPTPQAGADQRDSRSHGRGREQTSSKGVVRSTRGAPSQPAAGSAARSAAAARPAATPGGHAVQPRSPGRTGPGSAASSHSSANAAATDTASARSSLPTSAQTAPPSTGATHPPSSPSNAPHSASSIPGPPGGPSSRHAVFDAALAAGASRGRTPQPTSTVPLRHVQRLSHARAVSLGRSNARDGKRPAPDDGSSARPPGASGGGPVMPEDHAVRFDDESGSVTIRGGRIGGGSYMADSSMAEIPSPSDSAISFGQAAREMATSPTAVLAGPGALPATPAEHVAPIRPPSPPPAMPERAAAPPPAADGGLRTSANAAEALVLAPTPGPPLPPAVHVQKPHAPPSPPARAARGSPGAAVAERQAQRRPVAQAPRGVTAARSASAVRSSSRSRLDRLWSRGGSTPTRRATTGQGRTHAEGGHHSGLHAVSAVTPPRAGPTPGAIQRSGPRHFFHPPAGQTSPTKHAAPSAAAASPQPARSCPPPQLGPPASRGRAQPRPARAPPAAACSTSSGAPPPFHPGRPGNPPPAAQIHRSCSSSASGNSGASFGSSHGSTPAAWSPLGSQCMIRDACARLPVGAEAQAPSGYLPRSRSSSPPPSTNTRTLHRDASGPRSVDSCNLPVFPEDPQSASPSPRSEPHPLSQPPLPPHTTSSPARAPPPPSPSSPSRRRSAKAAAIALSPSHRSPSNCSSLAVRATESITDDSSSRVDSGITPVAHSSRIHDSGSLLAESCASTSQPPSSRARPSSHRPAAAGGSSSPRHQSPYLCLSPILSAGLAESPGTPTMVPPTSPVVQTSASPSSAEAEAFPAADAEAEPQRRQSAEEPPPIRVASVDPNDEPFEVNDFAARIMGLRPAMSAPAPAASSAAPLHLHHVDLRFAQLQREHAAAQARHNSGRPRSVPTLRTAPAAVRRASETNPVWDSRQPSSSAMVDLSPTPPATLAAPWQPPSPRRRLSPRPPMPLRPLPPEALAELLRHAAVAARTRSGDDGSGSQNLPSSLSGLSTSSVTARLLPFGDGHGAILPPPPTELSAASSPFGSQPHYPQYIPGSNASPPNSLSVSRHPSRPLPSYPSSVDSTAVRDIAAALAGPAAAVQGRRGIARSASMPTPGPSPPSPPVSTSAAPSDAWPFPPAGADAHHALRMDSGGRPLLFHPDHTGAVAAPPMIASESGHHTALQHVANPRTAAAAALRPLRRGVTAAAHIPSISISPDFDSYFAAPAAHHHAPASASTTPRNRHYALHSLNHRTNPPSSGASGSSIARSPTHPYRPAGASGAPRSRDRFVAPFPYPPPTPGSSSLSRRVSTATDFPLPPIAPPSPPSSTTAAPAPASPAAHAESGHSGGAHHLPPRSPSEASTTPAAAAAAASVAPDECFDAVAAMAAKHSLHSSINSGASVASVHSPGGDGDGLSSFSAISRGGEPLGQDPTLSLCGSAGGGVAWASCDGSVSLNWHILGTGSDCSFRHWSPTIAARSIAGGGGDTWNTLPEEDRSDMAPDAASHDPGGSSLTRSPRSTWADRGPIARHSHRSGTVMSDNCDSAEFSSGALFGPWHGRHGSLRRSAAGAAATCSSNSHSFSTTASTMVGAAAAAAAAAAAPSAAALRDDDTTTSSPGLSPKRGYSGLPAPLRSVVPVVALFGGWPRVAMSHLELSERLARVAADAAAAIAFLSTDKEGVELHCALAAPLQRQMPATARSAGVTALVAHYHAKLSSPSTPSAAACVSSPGQRHSAQHAPDLPQDWPQVTCALKPALGYLAAACTAAGSGDRVSMLLHLLSLQRLAALEASTHAAVAVLSHMRAVATAAGATQPAAAVSPVAGPKPLAAGDAASEHSSGRSSGLELRFPLEAAVLQGAVSAGDWGRSPGRGGAASARGGCVSDVSVDCEIMDSDAMDTASALAEGASPAVLATAARAADTVLAAVASAVDDSLPGRCGIGLAVRVSLTVRRSAAQHAQHAQHVEVLLSPRTVMTAPEAVLATSAAAWAAVPAVPAVDAPAFASGCSCASDCARGIRDLLCAAVQPGAAGAWQGAAMKLRPECVAPLAVVPLSVASISARGGAGSGAGGAPEVDAEALARLVVWPEQLLSAAAEAAARSAMGILHAAAGGAGWPPGCPQQPQSPATRPVRHGGSPHTVSADGDSDNPGHGRGNPLGSAVFMHHNGVCDDAADSGATDTTSPLGTARGRSSARFGTLRDLPRGGSSPSSLPVRRARRGDSSSRATSSPHEIRRSAGSFDNAGSHHTLQRSEGSVGSHYSPCLKDMLRNETVRRAWDARGAADTRRPTPPSHPEGLLPHADASSLARCITRSSSSSSSSSTSDAQRSRSASLSSQSLDGGTWAPGSGRAMYEEVEGTALGGLASLPSVGLGPPTAAPSSAASAPRSAGSVPRSMGSRREPPLSARAVPPVAAAQHLRSQPASRVPPPSHASTAYSSAYGSPMSPLTPASEGLPVRVRPPMSLQSGLQSAALPPRPPLSIGRRIGARIASQGVRAPPALLRSCFCVNPVAQLDDSSREL